MASKVLRRYTDIPVLLSLLSERKITLVDPRSWDDSNDSYYLALYKEKRNLKSVLGLCFTQAYETYHHWRVFAPGSGGVCVRFHLSQFLKAINGFPGLKMGPVKYLTLDKIRNSVLDIEDLPFLKRFAFEAEDELRLIYASKNARLKSRNIPIPLSSIEVVTLSPWIHPNLSEHVKRILWSIKGCGGLKIARSTLIGNEEWKRLGEAAR